MTIEAWRVIAEFEQLATAELDFGGAGGMATMVRELNLPDTVVDRLRQAIGGALQRLAARDEQQAVRLTVSAKVTPAECDGACQSWGFFLIEKPPHEALLHRIEVFLFQDGC